jgi:hypothetical protein
MMQTAVDDTGPRRHPGFDHDDCAVTTNAPTCFGEKPSGLRQMVEHIRHDDGSQRLPFKRQEGAIKYDLHTRGWRNVGGNEPRNEIAEKSCTRPDLEHWCVPGGKRFDDGGVPFLVDPPEKRLLLDDAATLLVETRIVQIEPAREGVS